VSSIEHFVERPHRTTGRISCASVALAVPGRLALGFEPRLRGGSDGEEEGVGGELRCSCDADAVRMRCGYTSAYEWSSEWIGLLRGEGLKVSSQAEVVGLEGAPTARWVEHTGACAEGGGPGDR